jgi:fructose-1,6-bisphosphatase/inositol monophosphatase family enzyme
MFAAFFGVCDFRLRRAIRLDKGDIILKKEVMNAAQLHRARRLLCALQDHILATLLAARKKSSANFARVAAVTAADTIYQVDRVGEAAIIAWFEQNWPRAWPVELVMEGIEDGESVTFPRGTPVTRTVFKCILDPIDGTRNLMHDKRSAWTLAALAPQRGAKTNLADLVVAAMTELPTSKQWRADQVSAVRGGGWPRRSTCATARGESFHPGPRRRAISSTASPRW